MAKKLAKKSKAPKKCASPKKMKPVKGQITVRHRKGIGNGVYAIQLGTGGPEILVCKEGFDKNFKGFNVGSEKTVTLNVVLS